MKEQLTFRELLDMIGTPDEDKLPGKKMLEETATKVVSYEDSMIRLTVYDSGYVCASFDNRWTVFPVADCGSYKYDWSTDIGAAPLEEPQSFFEAEYFMDQPWQLRVMMEANDRLERNNDITEAKHIATHIELLDNYDWLRGCEESPENIYIRHEFYEELMSSLTVKQREAMELWLEGLNQKEIGVICSVSQKGISDRLIAAKKKLKKILCG